MFKPQLTAVISKVLSIEGSTATVTIKHIKSGQMQNILQNSMEVISKPGPSGMETAIISNSPKRTKEIVLACVTDWSGFKDENDRNMKFTPLNLNKMMEQSSEFVEFIVAAQDDLIAEVEGEEEAVEKN
jgi:hypothetical protein